MSTTRNYHHLRAEERATIMLSRPHRRARTRHDVFRALRLVRVADAGHVIEHAFAAVITAFHMA